MIRFFGVRSFGVRSFGVRSFGVRSFGVRSFGVRSFGVRSFGMHSFGILNHVALLAIGILLALPLIVSPSAVDSSHIDGKDRGKCEIHFGSLKELCRDTLTLSSSLTLAGQRHNKNKREMVDSLFIVVYTPRKNFPHSSIVRSTLALSMWI